MGSEVASQAIIDCLVDIGVDVTVVGYVDGADSTENDTEVRVTMPSGAGRASFGVTFGRSTSTIW